MEYPNTQNYYSNYLNNLKTELIMFDPENDLLTYKTRSFSPNIFEVLDKNDFDYEYNTIALLIVCYYAIKNRCFNYAFKSNCSNEEVSFTESIRLWLETNSEKIINGNKNIEKLFARLMVLIYDKLLACKVEVFFKGETVPDGFIGFNVGHATFGSITHKNTSKTVYMLGMQLIGIWDRKDEYYNKRHFWAKVCGSSEIRNCNNTFLYNCYDLKEINKFLEARYNLKLESIKTKWYKDYLANWNRRQMLQFPFIKIIKMLVLNAKGNYEEALVASGAGTPADKYTFFEKLLSCFKEIIPISPFFFLLEASNGNLKMAAGIVTAIIAIGLFLFGGKILERKKRKTFSLLKNIIN